MKRYNPKAIEPLWQKQWADSKIYEARDFDERPKFVMLTEFPYPSGTGIHLGHAREYTYGDIISRYKRMQGCNVLYPMGYDAFGLPTENYAIKNKISPEAATEQNVASFQTQMERMGYGIDWSRVVRTSDPGFYKWTQWLFLRFFKEGLAYQDDISINWCPHCKTGLANEEVINGRHERCDTLVEKKQLKQWMLKITQYADRLIDGLKTVDYPSRIADQQINWIGRKAGINITYPVTNGDYPEGVTVFTTRPDTNFGATFVVLAPEHPLVQKIVRQEITPSGGHSHREAVSHYIQKTMNKTEIERQEEGRKKTGVFTGFYVKNHLTGKDMPVWVSDFVLAGFGTGALVGVPGHDVRDFQFAREFDLPIVRVVVGPDGDSGDITSEEQVQEDSGTMLNSGFLDGMNIHDATRKVMEYIEEQGWGERKVSYRLRDWIFSRQHYWGEPIPIIHCPDHGAVAVPDDQLPVELPKVDHYEPTDTGESPLAAITEWVNTTCPTCGKPARRETDTMPNWAGSSWYYLRYYDAHNDQAFADRTKLDYWADVDLYLGGMEHTTLHLLYSRFWHQFFYDQGLVPTPEPYAARRGQGIILAADGTKMSKSKGNVVDPTEVIDSGYGADALRLAIAFLAPYDQTTPWSPEGVAGTFRFLQRVWNLAGELNESPRRSPAEEKDNQKDPPKDRAAAPDTDLKRAMHRAIQRVTHDLDDMGYNTAIAALMETLNELTKLKPAVPMSAHGDTWRWAIKVLLQLLAPFAPHIAEELWQELGETGSIHTSPWPKHDEQYLIQDTMTIVIQINGKLRSQMQVPSETDKERILEAALGDVKIQAQLAGREVKKSVYVPGKLVNFVV